MSFNEITIQAYYQAVKLMFSNQPIDEGMKALDHTARELAPHPIWDKLRQIDFAQELTRLAEWTAQEIAQHKDNLAIILFRLSDLGDQMSLIFLHPEREPDGDDDWEAYDDSLYADVPSEVLVQMAEQVEAELIDAQGNYTNENAGWIAETCYPLAYAGLAVGKMMHTLPPEALLGNDAVRKVAVFFNEGDEFLLGEITRQGFTYYPVPDFIA